MARNIPNKYLEFDDRFNGVYTAEKNLTPNINMKRLINYCRSNNISPENLNDQEIKEFCVSD